MPKNKHEPSDPQDLEELLVQADKRLVPTASRINGSEIRQKASAKSSRRKMAASTTALAFVAALLMWPNLPNTKHENTLTQSPIVLGPAHEIMETLANEIELDNELKSLQFKRNQLASKNHKLNVRRKHIEDKRLLTKSKLYSAVLAIEDSHHFDSGERQNRLNQLTRGFESNVTAVLQIGE